MSASADPAQDIAMKAIEPESVIDDERNERAQAFAALSDGVKTKNEALRELLKSKCQEGADLLTHYLRAFVIYVAVTGALLKFALDQQSTRVLFLAMASLGLMISLLGLLVCAFGEHLRRSIKRDIENLARYFEAPELVSNQLSLKYMTISSAIFVLVLVFGWVYLLITYTP